MQNKSPKPISILFENKDFVFFNKPSGLLVIPSPKESVHTLVNIVNKQCRLSQDDFRLYPCHRLDRDTSGVIVFAKGKSKQQKMMQLFKARSIKKSYIAFVHGIVKRQEGSISQPIATMNHHKQRAGKKALTQYKVFQRVKNFTILHVTPVTGRTNQIRIHLHSIGHPLVGERKFVFARDYDLKFKRTALHARNLELTDPITNQKIYVEAELPRDMKNFINKHTNDGRIKIIH